MALSRQFHHINSVLDFFSYLIGATEAKLSKLREALHLAINLEDQKETLTIALRAKWLAKKSLDNSKFHQAWVGFYEAYARCLLGEHEVARPLLEQFLADHPYLLANGTIPNWQLIEMRGIAEQIFQDFATAQNTFEQALYLAIDGHAPQLDVQRISELLLFLIQDHSPEFSQALEQIFSPEADKEPKLNAYVWAATILSQHARHRLGHALSRHMLRWGAEEKIPPQELGIAFCYEGIFLDGIGRGEEALEASMAALEIFQSKNAPLQIAICKHNIGLCLHGCGKPSEALAFFKEALAEKEALKDIEPAQLLLTCKGVGDCYTELGDFKGAELYLQRGLSLSQQIGSTEETNLLDSLGQLYHRAGNDQKAEAVFHECVAKTEQAFGPSNIFLAQTLKNLSYCLEKQHKYEDASDALEKSLVITAQNFDSHSPHCTRLQTRILALKEKASAQSKYFAQRDQIILQLLMETITIDGEIHDQEITRALKHVHERTHFELSAEEIRLQAQKFLDQKPPRSAVDHIVNAEPPFSIYDREYFLGLAFSLIRCDGVIQDSERDYINQMGQDLGFTYAHFQGVINQLAETEDRENRIKIWNQYADPVRKIYPDFDEAFSAVNDPIFGKIVRMYFQIPGGAFLLYELAKDPKQLAYLSSLEESQREDELSILHERIKIELGIE
jgi:tetratricopeptide (TPR) repeat protein